MKLWVSILLFTTCHAAVILTQRNPDDNGAAVTFQNQDELGQYDFGYNEGHPSGSSFRRESGDAFGNKIGSFGLRDADGRIRVVRYVADSNGFRAEVTSNEPGVAPQDPASATINKPAIVAVPPPPPPPPVVPLTQVAAYQPAPVVAIPKAYPPPPPAYNYAPAAVAVPGPPPPPPPPPPRAYFPPKVSVAAQVVPYPAPVAPYPGPLGPYSGPVAAYPAPVAAYPAPVAPVAVAPIAKGIAAFPPPPPPPYYTNLVQGKGYVAPLKNYPSFVPPFAAVPPQFGYLTLKSPPYYQALGNPL